MPIFKHDYPILEYDTSKKAVIEPGRHGCKTAFSPICVTTFFGEVLDAFVKQHNAVVVGAYKSEMREFPIYNVTYEGVQIALVQAVVGSASAAMMADYLFGNGVRTLIACGGCGVLRDIPDGAVLVPTSALRDEGASYHYLPPGRDITLDADMVALLCETLDSLGVPYIRCKTWTTDAFFRETHEMVAYRREEGCDAVEMECATLAAVARFRNARFAQLLYSGDTLADSENYDERGWYENLGARERLFMLALKSAIRAYTEYIS